MSAKKNTKIESPDNNLDNPKSDPVPSKNIETDLVITPDDDFQELFSGGEDNIKVQLYRVSPVSYNGKKLDGFIRYLFPGEDVGSISEKYGGGIYMIRKLVDGKFSAQRRLSVSGDPKVAFSPQPSDVVELNKPESTEDLGTVEFSGVKLSGSDGNFIKMMERIQIIKHAFPEKESINDLLLKLALDRGGNGMDGLLSNIDKMGSIIDRFNTGGGSGQTNWMDIVKSALGAFEKYVEKADASRRGIPPAKTHKPEISDTNKTALRSGELRQIPANNIVTEPGDQPVYTAESEPMNEPSQSEIIEKACSYIVGGFLQNPIQSEADTVLVLKTVLPPFDTAGLNGIYDNSRSMGLVAKSILTNQIETNPEIIEKFLLYFNNVVSIFCQRSEIIIEKEPKKESEAKNGSSKV